MSRAKTNTISSGQLACLLVITRLAAGLLSDSVSVLQLLSEIAVSAALSAAVWCIDKIGVQVKGRAGAFALTAAFFALTVWDCVSYAIFTHKVAHPEIPLAMIMALIAVFSAYAGWLGCEAVARFSALALMLVAACVLVAVVTNIPAARSDFFAYDKPQEIDAAALIKCLDVPVLFMLFSPHTAGKKGRALLIGTTVPYAVLAAVTLMSRAVLGRAAYLYISPIFALFQLAKAGLFTKLDILYICTMLILLFCELSLSVSAVKLLFNKGAKG